MQQMRGLRNEANAEQQEATRDLDLAFFERYQRNFELERVGKRHLKVRSKNLAHRQIIGQKLTKETVGAQHGYQSRDALVFCRGVDQSTRISGLLRGIGNARQGVMPQTN